VTPLVPVRPLTPVEVSAYEAIGVDVCDRPGCEYPPAFLGVRLARVRVTRDLLCDHHGGVCGPELAGFERCRHCRKLISPFGGIWFERHHSAVCYRSPDSQHRPHRVGGR
jgi:hypothetical protein